MEGVRKSKKRRDVVISTGVHNVADVDVEEEDDVT